MNAISGVIGFICLISGSQFYWAFVGGVAFFIGRYLGTHYHWVTRELDLIIFSFGLSGMAVMLSIYIRRLMIALAGFFIGIYIFQTLPAEFGWRMDWAAWYLFLLAGLVAGLAVFFWSSWATIMLSTIGGAAAVIQNLSFGGVSDTAIFIVLSVIGLTAQFIFWQYGKTDAEEIER